MTTNKDEEWKIIPNFSNYEVSKTGQVRSKFRHSKTKDRNDYTLSPYINNSGYWRVKIKDDNGDYKQMLVHRLVLLSFTGECPNGMETLHKDDDKSNNYLGNLEWGTKKENGKLGEKNPQSKLIPEDIYLIRSLRGFGWTPKFIAEIMDVSSKNISAILQGKTWSHI